MRTGQPVHGQAAIDEGVAEVRVQSAISAQMAQVPGGKEGYL